MDLIAQGRVTENLSEPSYELVDIFSVYWSSIMPPVVGVRSCFLTKEKQRVTAVKNKS